MARHVLDENTQEDQYPQLKRWRIPFDKVGDGFGYLGMGDAEIIRELHNSGQTFHTQDSDFYQPHLRHSSYCLVYYDVPRGQLAWYVRRFLRHPQFRTHVQRLGKIIRVTSQRIDFWECGRQQQTAMDWA